MYFWIEFSYRIYISEFLPVFVNQYQFIWIIQRYFRRDFLLFSVISCRGNVENLLYSNYFLIIYENSIKMKTHFRWLLKNVCTNDIFSCWSRFCSAWMKLLSMMSQSLMITVYFEFLIYVQHFNLEINEIYQMYNCLLFFV